MSRHEELQRIVTIVIGKDVQQCVRWHGAMSGDGYGAVYNGTKTVRAHRESYRLATGEDANIAMHTCDNRWCVNPNHIQSGTYKDNMQDMYNKGRNVRTAKLTDQQAQQILDSKERGCVLASHYNVSEATVSSIRHGTRWPHLRKS